MILYIDIDRYMIKGVAPLQLKSCSLAAKEKNGIFDHPANIATQSVSSAAKYRNAISIICSQISAHLNPHPK